ncbi:MAG TPA: 3-hydroxyacyl-CoA dehydrogenase [Chloroflexota bacterium]|jgi:NAD(P)-dependent dehydrogenase (short-subunit alcohol dehydrogenase family)|nr:3-hydroxyacyl-CoA dehydrogenase [Chloroflexota bacterium]
MQLAESVFLISGGASGLGAACVRLFSSCGARVVIGDVQAPTFELPAGTSYARTDVTQASDVQAAVDTAVREFGTLNGVVNCAGIGLAQRTIGREGPHPLDAFARVINVNLIGTFNVIRLATIAIAQAEPNSAGERGVVINTASVAAFEGQIGQAAYSASKGGIVGMTLPIARDLARDGIRVVTIAPGIFDTPLLAGLPEPARVSLGQQVPFPQRLGRPDEYAALARHIVENEMLNGEVIRLDGAIRMGPR